MVLAQSTLSAKAHITYLAKFLSLNFSWNEPDIMSLPALLLLNLKTPAPISSVLPTTTITTSPLSLSSQTTSKPSPKTFISPLFSLSSSSLHYQQYDAVEKEEEHVIGDCLVFEEGIFEDPNLEQRFNFEKNSNKTPKSTNMKVAVEPENLIPDKWKEDQAALNISKKERRKIAQEMEFGRSLEKKKQGLMPIRDYVLEKEYVAFRDEKLKQLKPLVLDNPSLDLNENGSDGDEERIGNVSVSSGGRVVPRNPRRDVYGGSLEDVSEFLNSEDYDPDAPRNPEGNFASAIVST